MTKYFITLLLSVFVCFTRSNGQENYCYLDDRNPYIYFSSATSYSNVRSLKMEVAKNCKPIYVWSLIKNGATYMSKEQIEEAEKLFAVRDEILKNHAERRGTLCRKDLNNLKNWNLKLDKGKADQLVTPGVIDNIQLARRLKSIFSSLFESVSKNQYEFQTSSAKIAKNSVAAFFGEFFQENVKGKDPKELGISENTLLEEDLDQNYNVKEMKDFLGSPETSRVMKEISTRLGFEKVLSFETLTSMYEVCSFENAWNTDPTPAFCAAFLPEELKMIEYAWDLGHYYNFGYGNTIDENSKKPLPLFESMLSKITEAADEKIATKASFHFSESSPVINIIKELSLYRDEQPLKRDNYETMMINRKWRSSFIDCFTSNIIAVVYSCSNDEDKRIEFYHNENLVQIPHCEKNYCTVEELKKLKSKSTSEPEKEPPKEKTDIEKQPKNEEGDKKGGGTEAEPKKEEKPKNEDTKSVDKAHQKNTEEGKEQTSSATSSYCFSLGVLCVCWIAGFLL